MKANSTMKSSLLINKLSGVLFLGIALSSSSYASGWHCNWGSDLTSIVTPSGEHKEVCRAEPKAGGVCPEGTSFMEAHVAETGENIASRCEGLAFYQ